MDLDAAFEVGEKEAGRLGIPAVVAVMWVEKGYAFDYRTINSQLAETPHIDTMVHEALSVAFNRTLVNHKTLVDGDIQVTVVCDRLKDRTALTEVVRKALGLKQSEEVL